LRTRTPQTRLWQGRLFRRIPGSRTPDHPA